MSEYTIPKDEPQALTVVESTALEERSVDDVLRQVEKVQTLMTKVMQKDHHYGVIPGTQKPTLLKPGAEKLCFTFRLIPFYPSVEIGQLPNGHREYTVQCELRREHDGSVVGNGIGVCSTMEAKYRWRKSGRSCPGCGVDAISRSKYADRETGEKGWYCRECKGQFAHDDKRVLEQQTGRVENPDIADQYNTVAKMAKKRASVDATISATAASDIFTQDVEDLDIPPPVVESNGKAENGDRKATEKQLSMIYAKTSKRCDETGALRDELVAAIKTYMGVASGKDIPMSRVDDVVHFIENWEPGQLVEGVTYEKKEPF